MIVDGQLDSVEGNLVRGRLGESARLYRLRIDGRWYFCTASRFASSKEAGTVLRHVRLPMRVTAATHVSHGRGGLYWLYIHDTGDALEPATFKRAGISLLFILLAALLGLALFFGWPWINRLPTFAFAVLLPVTLALMIAALASTVFAVFGMADIVSLLRPRRVRAYRAYLNLRKALTHAN
ncbi:hypothetical protein EC912_102769 [Luteibacter rhizovicinus]|uniref:Uncharacterized protein n=2 Tax=Luteibacter rhizovicinus TaxID=242606 RepID=A0A4R3YX55_9GAMM|nr:hypothetical protein EC912_102769 [Luteibacter rhizovicinus]